MKLMQWGLIFIFSMVLLGGRPQIAAAEQYGTHWIDSEQGNNAYTVTRKLGRGLVNAGFCWTEIVYQPYYLIAIENQRWPSGILAGVVRGVGFTVLRLFTGVYEVATFPFALPENYKPIVQPEYPLIRETRSDFYE